MTYAELLKSYIKNSRYTLDEISEMLSTKGVSASREHLSRIQNGKVPPGSDELNRAIAEVTGGDADALVISGYIEKAPTEVRAILEESKTENEVQTLLKLANKFLRFYLDTKQVSEDILNGLHAAAISFKDIKIDFEFFRNEPIAAVNQLIEKALLKWAYFYGDRSIYPTDKEREGTGLRSINDILNNRSPSYKGEYKISEHEFEFLEKVREIAAERDMDLSDPRFIGLIAAAMDFAQRISEEE